MFFYFFNLNLNTYTLKRIIHIIISVFLMIFLTFAGAMGYRYIEGWTFFESLYMTVITLATVGFREVRDLLQLSVQIPRMYF